MEKQLKPALVNIAVAVIFFNRDDSLAKVFEQIRYARPSELYLIQDGEREGNEADREDIKRCRKVFDGIDWECRVYQNYAEQNMGCGRRVSSGISWVFDHVDKAVILEDDCIIEPSFIQFAAELLNRYENDERITMISALNHFEKWNCGNNSYFFTKTGAIAAWATWQRVWRQFDFYISDFGDSYNQKVIANSFHHKQAAKARIKNWRDIYEKGRNGEKIRYWGPQFGYLKYKLGGVCIVPAHSLSNNVGVNERATFSGAGLEFMYKPMRQWFFQKTSPMEFPLRHPDIIQTDVDYDKKYYDITYPNEISRFIRKTYYFLKRRVYNIFFRKRKK